MFKIKISENTNYPTELLIYNMIHIYTEYGLELKLKINAKLLLLEDNLILILYLILIS